MSDTTAQTGAPAIIPATGPNETGTMLGSMQTELTNKRTALTKTIEGARRKREECNETIRQATADKAEVERVLKGFTPRKRVAKK